MGNLQCIHKQFRPKIFLTIALRALFKSFCEGKITTHLIAFFEQTIKEMFCNILKCSLENLVCTTGYSSSAVNFLYFDNDIHCPYLSVPYYSWFHGSVISKIWAWPPIKHGYGQLWNVNVLHNHHLIHGQVFWNYIFK